MLKRYNGVVGIAYRLTDVAVVACAWLAAYWLRFHFLPLRAPETAPDLSLYASLTPVVAVIWLVTFTSRGLYTSRRLTRLLREFQDVLHAHVIALVAFVALAYFFEHYKYSRLLMGYFAVLSGAAICVSRALVRIGLRNLRKRGFNQRSVIVAGSGQAARRAIDYTQHFPELGLQVAGVLTLDGRATEAVVDEKLLGSYSDILDVVERKKVDEVVIALPSEEQHQLGELLHALRDATTDVRVIPDVHAYATLGCVAEDFNGMPIVRINDSPLEGIGAYIKRSIDMLGAMMALLVFAPIMASVALLVKVTSPGPILYGQERMGLDGRTFKMLKFRSMKVDAERVSGAVWCQAADDRRTPIGAFLRKTSLDELPQFWNVLCGDMSLVGPRPERPVFVNKFRDEIPNYMLRHKVKAGITGWAQVNGWRGNTSLQRRIECDLFYIRNWSVGLDVRILFMTLWKGFVHKNAY